MQAKKFLIFSTLFILVAVFTIVSSCNKTTKNEEAPGLKDAYANLFYVGTALNLEQIMGQDSTSLEVAAKHFNSITAENVMKWEKIQPLPGQFDFKAPDKMVEFTQANNMFVVGHTLLWHAQTPEWVFLDNKGKLVSRDTLLARLKNHIFTVMGRYKGKVHGWDVVNEALEDNGQYRQSKWKQIIGDDYIQLAFEYAREADSTAELYYNDYNLFHKAKRDAVVEMVKDLQAKGVKIDGIGEQGHYGLDFPDLAMLDSSLAAFGSLGVKVMITELDVSVLPFPSLDQGADISKKFELTEQMNPYVNGMPDSVNIALASHYASLFCIFKNHAGVVSRVTLWGVNDEQSWRNYWPIFGRTDYPLLFDRNNQPKLVVDSLMAIANK